MKRMIFILFLIAQTSVFSQTKLTYHAASTLKILGRPFPQQTTYKRFPDSLEMHLRKPVWSLSKNSAGIAIYFETNSTQVSAKWKTAGEVSFQHVAGTLVKGVDLYGLDGNKWYYAGIGRPSNGTRHESSIIKGLDGAMRQYVLYLPCYDNTDSVEIGIDEHAILQMPTAPVLSSARPIVFYGTSILQGASAMRPGMAYPAILERRLQRETINLGFSGNGQLDSMLAVIMSTIDAACYVVDCGPNLTPEMSAARTLPFLKQLKKLKPGVPILLVSNIEYPHARFNAVVAKKIQEVNAHFLDAFNAMKKEGYKGIYFLPSTGLIGDDGEATVDGAHMTDLGFYRIANAIEKELKQLLK
jgi:hypothetical protein